MPIYQTNVWVCEVCEAIFSVTQETSAYSDPVVSPPDGREWGYTGTDEKLTCPDCLERLQG